MARIRVLRLMEYEYPDYETMDQDMSRWQVHANSTRRFGDKSVSSAIIAKPVTDPIDGAVPEMLISALQTSGEHHKQYFLGQIAKSLGVDISHLDFPSGVAP